MAYIIPFLDVCIAFNGDRTIQESLMKVPGILDSSIELLDSVFVLDYARTIRCTRCLTLGKLADRYFEFLELGLRI
jgi:hypothetical protein